MKRLVERVMPDGYRRLVSPFHMSMKGLENAVLCRDDEDYGVMVKYIAICARRKNVITIIYAVVSNHAHVAVLAESQKEADDFGRELKRIYSMWFSRKYKERGILQRIDARAVPLENEFHIRNALAYIPRNAQDNGCSPHDYKWSGFKAMFRKENTPGRPVRLMSTRDWEDLMHTGDSLKDVSWRLDSHDDIIPDSFCDSLYLEQAFNGDPSFFYRTIGSVNPAEMNELLVEGPRRMLPDTELYCIASDLCRQWFKQDLNTLPYGKKSRILSYLWRTRKTTTGQQARVLGLSRESVQEALGHITRK